MGKAIFTHRVLFWIYLIPRNQTYLTLKCLRSPIIFYLIVVVHHTHVRVVYQCLHSLLTLIEFNKRQISHRGGTQYDTLAHPIDHWLYHIANVTLDLS